MSGRLGAREADELIEQKLQRSMQLHDAMAQTIGLDDDSLVIADLLGTDIAMASIGLSMEHGDSLLVLMAHGNPNTATATLRMQFESLLRGAWAIYAATEQEIEALERELTAEADAQGRKVAVYGDMLKALRKESCQAPRGLVDQVDQVLRHGMNSFVHGGFQPLKHHHVHLFPVWTRFSPDHRQIQDGITARLLSSGTFTRYSMPVLPVHPSKLSAARVAH